MFMNFSNFKGFAAFTICMLVAASLCCSCRTSKVTAETSAIASDSTAVKRSLSVLSAAVMSSENFEVRFDSITVETVIPVGDTVEDLRIKAIGCRVTSHKETAAETIATDVSTDSISSQHDVWHEKHTAQQCESPSSSMLPLIAMAIIVTFIIAVRRK